MRGSHSSSLKTSPPTSPGMHVQVMPVLNVQVQGYGSSSLSEQQTIDSPPSPSPVRNQSLRTGTQTLPSRYGFWFDLYLDKHGYGSHAREVLERRFEQTHSESHFIELLVSTVNITRGEASFIFQLMSHQPEGPEEDA
ncbi:hypothetical protein Hypma_011130 [Hypsizygus marmoreus]|uniref:Uncharacterized protein n=1 Tax=Hypsizygus marmoreus TaxID=39966 RepID=A0A369JRB9_HYPMA|nr:hypothetical protein Hypma_011130 [Hypsizygus marmoreus]